VGSAGQTVSDPAEQMVGSWMQFVGFIGQTVAATGQTVGAPMQSVGTFGHVVTAAAEQNVAAAGVHDVTLAGQVVSATGQEVTPAGKIVGSTFVSVETTRMPTLSEAVAGIEMNITTRPAL